jgi:glycosyltransferase involved in cell wall biosynthesis
MPLVSVIVPNYNHAIYLQQRLDSIFNQTFQDYEVILLDDCSTDNSHEIIERYRNHSQVSKVIYNKVNAGTSYKQWYKGIEFASGELIWIAESDDWCDVSFLESTINYFNDPKVALVFVKTQFVSSIKDAVKGSFSGEFVKYSGIDFIRDKMLSGNKIPNASMAVFRKKSFEKVKDLGFRNMKLAGDWLLWIQIIYGNDIIFVSDKLSYCRRHDANLTNRFRSQGYDFIEGLEILQIGKKYCDNTFNRKQVYLSWIDYFNVFKSCFEKETLMNVLIIMLFKEPLLFGFLVYKKARTKIKRLFNLGLSII